MDKNIQEGNELIAEFMGVNYDPHPYLIGYHTSWDWLMPVVEKINQTKKYDVIIYRTTCHINNEHEMLIETVSHDNKLIGCVWLAVVKFLKEEWYNQNKQQ